MEMFVAVFSAGSPSTIAHVKVAFPSSSLVKIDKPDGYIGRITHESECS